jgi:hypothetical protein
MTRKQIPTWGFSIAAIGFAAAAVVRVLKGGGLNTTFVVLALVFAALGITVARRNRGADSTPLNGRGDR